jgi:pSer/pThr/pTyr-binding forkhead associated (FHA) protein
MSIKLNIAIRVPEEATREFDLSFDKFVITIGRDRENDIQIPLSTVSRRHARILVEQERWLVEDLRSTHGTKVNGQALGLGGKKFLSEGDQIQIVHAFITYHEINREQLEEGGVTEEKTAIVARKMVQNIFENSNESAEVPHLVVMNGSLKGKNIAFGPDVTEVVFGRGENCDVRLEDVNVSRRHAIVSREWNEFFVEDLGSKNGVILNGKKTSGKTRLSNNDEIDLGAIRLIFVDQQSSILEKLGEITAFANETKKNEVKNVFTLQGLPGTKAPFTEETTSKPIAEPLVEPEKLEKSADVTVSQARFKPSSRKRFGTEEYVLLALVGLVVVGLIVGVVVALD